MLNTKMAIIEKAKHSIVLFKVLPGQTSITLNEKIRDMIDVSQQLKEDWAITYCFYKDIITGQEKEISCDKACEFFQKIINSLTNDYSLGDLKVSEDLLKLYIFAFKKTSSSIICFIQSEGEIDVSESVKRLGILTDFLLFSLQNRKKQICSYEYLKDIMQIVKENINKMHEILEKKQNSQSTLILHYFVQALMIIVASSECLDNDPIKGTEIAIIAFNTLISCLKSCFSSKQIQDIYFCELSCPEKWEQSKVLHIEKSVQFMKKKISIIHIGSNTNQYYTLYYFVIYFLMKIVKLIKESNEWEKEIIEVLGNVIKANLYSENMKIESKLNQNTISLKLLNLLIQNTEDPQGLVKGFISETLINELVQFQIIASIKNQLVAKPELHDNNVKKALEELSYNKTRDYISNVFLFLNAQKKFIKNISQGALASIISFFEDTFAELIMRLDELEGRESDLQILKYYIVEYLKKSASKQLPGQIMQLMESKIFHLTSPPNLEFKQVAPTFESEIDVTTNCGLISLLNGSITKSWATKILHALMSKITESINNEINLLALYKLLYCTFTNEVYDNSTFAFNYLCKLPPKLDYESFLNFEQKSDNNSMVAFVEIKGTQTLFQILLSHYEILNSNQISFIAKKEVRIKEISIEMTENFVLHLHNFPIFCEELLKNPKTINGLLEFYKLPGNHQETCLNLLEKLLASIKYSKKLEYSSTERNTYLPYLLFRFIQHHSSSDSEKAEHLIPFIEILVNFIAPEEKCPSLIELQRTLFSTIKVSSLFTILQDNK